jgi:3'-phosphoadenosine 5'-phosphosulfate sulfotransferase (PAPS reductase)/FAD synthetase
MSDPFLIYGPACISFSGGRTSAYMLRRILDAHGAMPDDVHVLFANTGRERIETLDFVRECAVRWNVRVRWLEYTNFAPFVEVVGFDANARPVFAPGALVHTVREVTHETAARDGEPFTRLVHAWKHLPNPVMRLCTQGLKIRPMRHFAQSVLGLEHWTSVLGLRADEPLRVARSSVPTRERWENTMPLASAGVTVEDVMRFWAAQPFDLRIPSGKGNCDLCFLKGRGNIERTMRERPDLARWWIDREAEDANTPSLVGLVACAACAGNGERDEDPCEDCDGSGYVKRSFHGRPDDRRFRHDRPSYASMLRMVEASPLLPGLGLEDEADRGGLPCACTD